MLTNVTEIMSKYPKPSLPGWTENTDPFTHEFSDGAAYLFAVLVFDSKNTKHTWEIDKVCVRVYEDSVDFYHYNPDEDADELPWDGWSFEDVDYFMELGT